MINIVEQFIKIEGYEDYEVSNLGRIRSLKKGSPKILTPWLDGKKRYYMISLCKNGEQTKFLIHRLVAEHFIPNLEHKEEVNHIDHDSKNNRVDNLEWVTRKENMYHCFEKYPADRNVRPCILEAPDGEQKYFKSVSEMQRYCENNNLPLGKHSIVYYSYSRGYKLHKL